MLNTDTQIGWQDYLAIVLRRRWFFIVPCALIVTVSLVVGVLLPKYYRAETILLVQDQNVVNPLIQGLAISTPVQERLRTLREELLSWTSLSRLVNELKLDRHAKSPMAFEKLIKRLQRDISVRMRGGDLVTIGYEDQNPKLAQQLVNTITAIYMARNTESEGAEAGTAINIIEKEMAIYKKKLEDAERALRDFKELYVMQMPVANQLNDELIDLEVQLAKLSVEDTESHPTVIQTRRQIAELKQKRNEEIKRVILTAMAKGQDPKMYEDLAKALEDPTAGAAQVNPSARAAAEAYQAWVSRLDSATKPAEQSNATQVQVVTNTQPNELSAPVSLVGGASLSLGPREDQELARLTRDYEVYSATYRQMQERLEKARTTQRLGGSDEGTKFKVLEPARVPLHPVRPNLLKIFGFALFLGVFVGAGAAFVAEYLDQSFQSTEDVQAALELPVIGSISTIVTEADLEAKRKHRRGWVTFQNQLRLIKTYAVDPVWSLVDRVLVRLGL